jgi:hypothetical protein
MADAARRKRAAADAAENVEAMRDAAADAAYAAATQQVVVEREKLVVAKRKLDTVRAKGAVTIAEIAAHRRAEASEWLDTYISAYTSFFEASTGGPLERNSNNAHMAANKAARKRMTEHDGDHDGDGFDLEMVDFTMRL